MMHVIALFGLGITLWIIARITRRFSHVLHAPRYYYALYVAGALVWGGATTRLFFLTGVLADFDISYQNTSYTLLADGLPALGMTFALFVAWYYWSWLLAERE